MNKWAVEKKEKENQKKENVKCKLESKGEELWVREAAKKIPPARPRREGGVKLSKLKAKKNKKKFRRQLSSRRGVRS